MSQATFIQNPSQGAVSPVRQGGPPPLISIAVQSLLLLGLGIYLAVNIVFDEDPIPALIDGLGGAMFLLLLASLFFQRATRFAELKTILLAAGVYLFLLTVSTILNGNPRVGKGTALLLDMFIEGKLFFIAFAMLFALPYHQLKRLFTIILLMFLGMALLNTVFIAHDMVIGTSIHGERLQRFVGVSIPMGLFNQKTMSVQIQLFAFIVCMAFLRDPRQGSRILFRALAALFFFTVLVHLSVKEIVAAIAVLLLMYGVRPDRTIAVGAAIAVPLLFLASIALLVDSPIRNSTMNRVETFLGETSAKTVRSASYTASVDLAVREFPVGTGASTFMSKGARDLAYSPVYYQTGMNRLHGGTPRDPQYLMDTFWPKILGQTGIFGLIAFGFLVLMPTVLAVMRLKKTDAYDAFAAAGILVSIATASLAAPVYTDDHLIFLSAAAIALTLSHRAMTKRHEANLCKSTSSGPAAFRPRMEGSKHSLQG